MSLTLQVGGDGGADECVETDYRLLWEILRDLSHQEALCPDKPLITDSKAADKFRTSVKDRMEVPVRTAVRTESGFWAAKILV